ncbi:FMN-binding negative transcriptional regulator [Hoeflea sp. G2-23]|uniref:FMN-binding negative transcriptional regulator n=1 Tax=Hoeflea algicola TaxID=2983763 RepID=A0ABT3ZDM5_9HYPH|nr:FMN-binding negative transcriptional regulator [Hoeflea algicola]MCY0149331.1 FMN-binding negative transcriptional regulator [Hoeflea algicola]
MYQPPHFAEPDEDVMRALITAHPLGLLISSSADDLQANPLPFLVSVDDGITRLRTHMSRANGQWRHIEDGASVLVVFQGVDSYITPSWYRAKSEHGKVVPTWNYAMVQARGSARIEAGSDRLRQQVGELTDRHEANRAEPWKVDDAPEAYVAAQLRGIVGIDITVDTLTGKWKMSQNRSEADRKGVHAGLTEDGDAAMAELVRLYSQI